jgi:transporter family-2 protein
MAGFLIAMISGALMSIQGVFNTGVTKSTSNVWVAAGFVQLTAFLTCVVMWLYNGRPTVSGLLEVEPKIALLGGVIGAFITYTVVKSMSDLGTAKAQVTIVITQIAVAYLVEIFGLFGSKKADFSWVKLLGIAVAVAGIFIFTMCGNKGEA